MLLTCSHPSIYSLLIQITNNLHMFTLIYQLYAKNTFHRCMLEISDV